MAFSHLGLQQYLERSDAIKFKREEEESQREALAFELAMKYGNSGLGSGSKTKGGALNSNIAIQRLKKEFNVSDEALAPIIASGDPSGAGRLLSVLETQRLKYENKGLTIPDEDITSILESVVIGAPKSEKLDIERLEKYIGREMDSLYKELLQNQTQSSQVYVPQPAFVETPDLEDLDRFEQRAIKNNLARAKAELRIITDRISELTSVQTSSGLSREQESESSWLAIRKSELDSAIKDNKNEDVTGLVSLYGSAYFNQLREFYPNFDKAPLNPALLNAARQNIRVSQENSDSVIFQLIQLGILKAGDVVDVVSQTGEIVDQVTLNP
jgi:hypothetical protein